jgi:regulator of nucleoside diphosphate kinase
MLLGDLSMLSEKIIITAYDYLRLRGWSNLDILKSDLDYFKKILSDMLDDADIVSPWEIPPEVVTMNSKVHLKDYQTQEELILSLVFPPDADLKKNRLSILTPLGVSLLGSKVGQQIETRIEVKQLLYQPESAGDFHL